jgi:hypothetical protein
MLAWVGCSQIIGEPPAAEKPGETHHWIRPEDQTGIDSHSRKVEIDGQPYVLWFRPVGEESELAVCRRANHGRLDLKYAARDQILREGNAIMDARALGAGRVLADLHVNPSLAIFVVIDLGRRRHDAYLGTGYAWDEKGSRLAYWRDPPHLARESGFPTLYVGHREVRAFKNGTITHIAWASADTVTVSLQMPDGRLETVAVNAGPK